MNDIITDSELGIKVAPDAVPPVQPKQQPAPVNRSGVISDADLGLLSARPDLREKYDVPKSALSAAERLPIAVVNAPADIMNFVTDALEKGVAKTAEGAIHLYNSAVGDSNTPEGEARLAAARKGLSAAHYVNEATKPYSTSEIAQALDPEIKKVLPVGPAYESKTGPGKLTQTVIDVGAPGLMGKGKAAEKLLRSSGAILGVEGGEALSDEFGITDPTARSAISILGSVLGHGAGQITAGGSKAFGNAINPNPSARELIAQKIAQARAEGRAPTEQEIQDAVNAGADIKAYDVVGERGPELMRKGMTTPEGYEAATRVNDFIQKRGEQAYGRVDENIDRILGRKVDAGATKEEISKQQKADNGPAYDAAINNPMASNVESPFVESLKEEPRIQSAFDRAVKDMGGYQPTLKFWDEVKRNLNDDASEAFRNGRSNLGTALQGFEQKLRDDLKAQNPGYAEALDGASSFFKSKNALEAGYKYASQFNTFDEAAVREALKKYSPDQIQLFQDGFVSALKDKSRGGVEKLLNNLDSNVMQKKLQDIFPSKNGDQARQIQAMIDLENMTQNADTLKFVKEAGGEKPSSFSLSKYIPEGIASLMAAVGTGAATTPTVGGAVGVMTLAASELGRVALNLSERRIAGRVAQILDSGDQAQILALSQEAARTPAVMTVLQKMRPFLDSTALHAVGANAYEAKNKPKPRDLERPERKHGGSVIDKKAEALVNESMRNQKLLANHTEQMLSMPDDAIVQALHVAKNVSA
jgi:hypothetical protein